MNVGPNALFPSTIAQLYLAAAAHSDEVSKRPNIVVVLVDDLRWDELCCSKHPFVRMPNIDRIASEGARFRNAVCTTPLCSPVRASLLTGLHRSVARTDRAVGAVPENRHGLQRTISDGKCNRGTARIVFCF